MLCSRRPANAGGARRRDAPGVPVFAPTRDDAIGVYCMLWIQYDMSGATIAMRERMMAGGARNAVCFGGCGYRYKTGMSSKRGVVDGMCSWGAGTMGATTRPARTTDPFPAPFTARRGKWSRGSAPSPPAIAPPTSSHPDPARVPALLGRPIVDGDLVWEMSDRRIRLCAGLGCCDLARRRPTWYDQRGHCWRAW
jgi:hypothetical protein